MLFFESKENFRGSCGGGLGGPQFSNFKCFFNSHVSRAPNQQSKAPYNVQKLNTVIIYCFEQSLNSKVSRLLRNFRDTLYVQIMSLWLLTRILCRSSKSILGGYIRTWELTLHNILCIIYSTRLRSTYC